MSKFYNQFVSNTVGDGREYKQVNGIFYSEEPFFTVAAAPAMQVECELTEAEAIGPCAFSDCTLLASVHFPNVRYISDFAFYGCRNLKNYDDLSNVVVMGDGAFCGTGLEHAELTSLVNLPLAAFGSCRELESVTLCDEVRHIGESAFASCPKLHDIVLPKNLVEIDYSAFYGCAIERITLPPGIKRIEDSVFARCENLREVIIPDGKLESIGDCAFLQCPLKTIYLPPTVREIHEYAFFKSALETVICRRGSFAEEWAKGSYKIEYRE